ncbi:MAG: AMP-binding protein, partial [Methanobrevibacter sp.]|nr:AMP-binding protein [Methanobrevibacter sp.]
YVLLLDFYHAIFDGESSKIFIENLLDFYNNTDCEKKPLLNINQYTLLEEDLSQKTKDYWDEYIKQIDAVIDLSYMKNYNEDIVPISYFDLDKELVKELSDFCKLKNISKASFLLSCYQALLYKYSGQDSFTISMPFNGRDLYEIRGTVGMFVKNLPIVFKNQGSIDDILHFNNQTIMNHRINQNCNLIDIHNNIHKDVGSFFETSFEYLDININKLDIAKNDLYNSVSELTKYKDVQNDLMFFFLENNENNISLRIDTTLLSKNQLDSLYEHFINIVKYFIENSDKKIDDFSCITPKEKDLILNEFNDTGADYPRDLTVVDLFEIAVEENSNSIALTFEDESLTYDELNERINAFAHNVEKQISLDNNDFIAIITNRSIEMIIGIYTALKLG